MGSQSNSNAPNTTHDITFTNAFAPGNQGGGQTAVNLADSAGSTVRVTTTDQGAIRAGRDVALKSLDFAGQGLSNLLTTDNKNYGRLLDTTSSTIQRVLDAASSSQQRANERFASLEQYSTQQNQAAATAAQGQSVKLLLGLGGMTALVLVFRGKN